MSKRIPERLASLVGREHSLAEVPAALREAVAGFSPPVVGAYQICCSDESEKENVATFHKSLVRNLLPQLKPFSRSAFRTVTLGGRYERGAVAIAESHYATEGSRDSFKVMVIKVNSHVGVIGNVYGKLGRYGQEDLACGAMSAMLAGAELPAIDELRRVFGQERLTALTELIVDNPDDVPLRASIVNSILQTRAVVLDAAGHAAKTPTIYIVAGCVTLNREREDTELVTAVALLDSRDPEAAEVVSLEDDPRGYRLEHDGKTLKIGAT